MDEKGRRRGGVVTKDGVRRGREAVRGEGTRIGFAGYGVVGRPRGLRQGKGTLTRREEVEVLKRGGDHRWGFAEEAGIGIHRGGEAAKKLGAKTTRKG
jgi:hypothetical protein